MIYFKMPDFRHTLILLALLGLFMPALPAPASATEAPSAKAVVIENGASGQIDWTKGTVRAIGSQPPLRNATGVDADKKQFSLAKSAAQKALLTAIKGVRIHPNHLVEDVLSNQQIMAELQTLIVETSLIEREYLSDKTVRVVLEIPLHGAVSQLLLPREIQPIQPITTTNIIGEAIAAPDPYTGLIVDARALELLPTLVPEIIDDTGEPVYGAAFVSRESVVGRGMVSYARQEDSVGFAERVGLNPLIIHGLKLADNNSGTIVVSSGEAAKVREASAYFQFLRQCRVIIRVK